MGAIQYRPEPRTQPQIRLDIKPTPMASVVNYLSSWGDRLLPRWVCTSACHIVRVLVLADS